MIPELVGEGSDGLPPSKSQAAKWTKAVRERLPVWVRDDIQPLIQIAVEQNGLAADVTSDADKVLIEYEPLHKGTGYVPARVLLEFGARSTGEPAEINDVVCDIAGVIDQVSFPEARPRVMKAERTFWEKATAAHVYCAQETFRGGHGYARHWYDLHCLEVCGVASNAIEDVGLAAEVAKHKQYFFRELDTSGELIEYKNAVSGRLNLVPEGLALSALAEDYAKMGADGLFSKDPPKFDELMVDLQKLQDTANETLN